MHHNFEQKFLNYNPSNSVHRYGTCIKPFTVAVALSAITQCDHKILTTYISLTLIFSATKFNKFTKL